MRFSLKGKIKKKKKKNNSKTDNNKIEDNKFSLNNNNMSKEEKNKSEEKDKSMIISKIIHSKCLIYFGFIFARRKRNMQNILLDEGMDIIVNNLDIRNIFKKIYGIGAIEDSLKEPEHILNMSDTCKAKMHDLFLSKQ